MAKEGKMLEKLKKFNNYANECVYFKYIFDESDLNQDNDENTFRPEFMHQIFGDDENIFGYRNLKVNYYLTPGLLEAYIGLNYAEKISPSRFDGIEADDVCNAFSEFGCSPGFTTNLDVFAKERLRKDLEFRPFGMKINEYRPENSENNYSYEIFKVDATQNDFESKSFVDYIERVQTMLVYYIETSSFVDTEDPQWVFYLLYEKRKNNSSVDTSMSNRSDYRYATIGYVSVYNYFAYPDKVRSRVSQIMIFPKYQKSGHGARLLESVYKDAVQNPLVIDITAESPSPEFIKLRDFVTTSMCAKLPSFQNEDSLRNGFSSEMIQQALREFKIPKLQSRRCYEILRMACTNRNLNDEWTKYRLDVKKRLNKPFVGFAKYARKGVHENEIGSNNPKSAKNLEPEDEPNPSKRIRFDLPKSDFGSKFGGSNVISETIGFGSNESNSKSSIIEPKKVSFSSKKTVNFNGSNSSADVSTSDDDQDAAADDQQGNLFLSEIERKKYLEDQFIETTQDYDKILRRLNIRC